MNALARKAKCPTFYLEGKDVFWFMTSHPDLAWRVFASYGAALAFTNKVLR